jgi:protein phosphatase
MEVDPASADAEHLLRAIKEANLAIATRSLEDNGLLGMGTTLTAALIRERTVTVVHVGDSRAYLLHEGRLTQLTDDHSWVGEMIRRGELTPSEAATHPHRSIITKALGTDTEVEPDVLEIPVAVGDRLLLCSDGLTGMVSDPEVERILSQTEAPEVLAGQLIQAALAGGGEDNVTVIVVEVAADGDVGVLDEGSGSETAGELILGPADRGTSSFHRSRVMPMRGVHRGAVVRERLGKKVAPILRPPSRRPADPSTDSAEVFARHWTRRRLVLVIAVVLLVLVVAVVAFALVNSTVYYVGVADGFVALFQGLPGSVLGIDLSQVIERGGVSYDSLPAYVKSRVDAHDLVSKEEGQVFLRSLSVAP